MTKHMQIRNREYDRLKSIKIGDCSFSDVIESLLNKAGVPVVSPTKDQPLTATTSQMKEGVADGTIHANV